MKTNFRICISSPPDREKLVAEIFFGEFQWAEINQESDAFEVEFYPLPGSQPWRIEYHEAIRALDEARSKLERATG